MLDIGLKMKKEEEGARSKVEEKWEGGEDSRSRREGG